MTYLKAYKGIKKLFVGGILSMAGSVCVWLSFLPGILGITAVFQGSFGGFFAGEISMLILLLAGVLLPIIAYILKVVGLGQASDYDPQFHQGFYLAILALIFILLETVFSAFSIGGSDVNAVVETVCTTLDVVVAVYSIYGIQNLAKKLEEWKMVQRGSTMVTYITILYAVCLFANLMLALFGSNLILQILIGLLTFITSILNIVVYIMFLVYLGKAAKMLKNNKDSSYIGNRISLDFENPVSDRMIAENA